MDRTVTDAAQRRLRCPQAEQAVPEDRDVDKARVLLVDAANVVGSRPDGWWRDRPGAAARLVAGLRTAVRDGALRGPVVVVLEGAARAGAEPGTADEVQVVHASGSGDDALAGLAAPGSVLVSADRELGRRARAAGAEVVGPRWLLERIPDRST